MRTSKELAREIKEQTIPEGSVGLWWLGQSGYIFKSPDGSLLAVDLYLSDSCANLRHDIDLRRQVPILLDPAHVEVDVFACTHNHRDHTDPETIRHLEHKDAMYFVGPHPSCSVFRDLGAC